MTARRLALPSLLVSLGAIAPAAAQPSASPAARTARATPAPAPLTVGARVGGYGFRRDDGDRRAAWDDCRMNGLGVFARRDLGRLNLEAGADLYFTESFPMAPTAQANQEDRLSGLVTIAAGARIFQAGRFSGMAQLGTGVERTRFHMTMASGLEADATKTLPMGFVGVTTEVRLGARTAAGASLRAHVMGKFTANDACQLEVHSDAAAQGQFYLAYQL